MSAPGRLGAGRSGRKIIECRGGISRGNDSRADASASDCKNAPNPLAPTAAPGATFGTPACGASSKGLMSADAVISSEAGGFRPASFNFSITRSPRDPAQRGRDRYGLYRWRG